MTISSKAAARKICELSDWKVTNLQLNKILYLAHMGYMWEHKEPLIDQCFEAWDYGPVVPAIYHEAKKYGAKPIKMGFYTNQDISGSPEENELTQACIALLPQSPARLVSFTHREEGAWAKHYRPGQKGVVIPNKDIVQEYESMLERPDGQ
jgi:uncharacterized phage-associated protein